VERILCITRWKLYIVNRIVISCNNLFDAKISTDVFRRSTSSGCHDKCSIIRNK